MRKKKKKGDNRSQRVGGGGGRDKTSPLGTGSLVWHSCVKSDSRRAESPGEFEK